MSCYYKTLPSLIPQLLLLARPNSEIALVSPWLENVTLYPPVFGSRGERQNRTVITLSDFVARLAQDLRMHFMLLVREHDARTALVVESVRRTVPNGIEVREVEHLHAKMVVTEAFALETSANILTTSLYRNIESCQLVVNRFGNARQYVRDKLSVSV